MRIRTRPPIRILAALLLLAVALTGVAGSGPCADLLTRDDEGLRLESWDSLGCGERPVIPAAELDRIEELARKQGSDPGQSLDFIESLYDRIGVEVSAQGYARLHDSLSVRASRRQQYGTRPPAGRTKVEPGQLARGADTARDRIGLEPLEANQARLLHDPGREASGHEARLALRPVVLPTRPELRSELLSRRAQDRESQRRDASEDFREEIQRDNADWVGKLLIGHGFPTEREVGRSGLDAVFFLVQHSADAGLTALAAQLATQRVDSGELAGVRLAMMLDRARVLVELPQLYATQYGADRYGRFTYPIHDIDSVNKRRATLRMTEIDLEAISVQRWPNVPLPGAGAAGLD